MSITFTPNQSAKRCAEDVGNRLDSAALMLAEIRGFLLIGQSDQAARAALMLKREIGVAWEAARELEGALSEVSNG